MRVNAVFKPFVTYANVVVHGSDPLHWQLTARCTCSTGTGPNFRKEPCPHNVVFYTVPHPEALARNPETRPETRPKQIVQTQKHYKKS